MEAWNPPEKLITSEWAERYRWLSPESAADSAAGGVVKFHNDRAPYQREMMDALHEPGIRKVVLMTSAQVGKSTIIEDILARYLDVDPCPMIVMLPTVDKGHEFSKERLSPMFRDTPKLRGLFPPAKSRDSNNTILVKQARNGAHLAIVGANSPSGLSSRPRRGLFVDELDRTKESAGVEGDPYDLIKMRLVNYQNSFEVLASTPSIAATSPIYREFLASDQRYFNVQCPLCGEYIVMEYKNLKWETQDDVVVLPSVEYRCQVCGCKIERSNQPTMIDNGKWVPTQPTTDTAGFHLWTIYSPWVEWTKIAKERHAAGRDPHRLKVFYNTFLGVPWEEKGETADYKELLDRREGYDAQVPNGPVLLTAGVDTHDDRLETTIYGWGRGEECWAIAHIVIDGDPSVKGSIEEPSVWTRLDDVLFVRKYMRADGIALPVTATCIDSAGHRTSSVYEYCSSRLSKHVYPIIGRAGEGRPVIGSPSSKISARVGSKLKVWTIGTFEAKGIIYSRFGISEPGQGYVHFPDIPEFGKQFMRQITAEVKVPIIKAGMSTYTWKIRKGRNRNEALDNFCYALGALRRINPDWNVWEERLKSQLNTNQQVATESSPEIFGRHAVKKRRGGYANRGRG